MNKIMYVGLFVVLIFLASYVGYEIGFNQNVMEVTDKIINKWCEEHDTNCMDICNQKCILKNQQCSDTFS